MVNMIRNFFKAPTHEEIEKFQKSRFLHIILIVFSFASVLLGVQNSKGNTNLDIILFSIAVICLLCIPLNKRGYYTAVAGFVYVLFLTTITFSLIDGVGLMDAGMLAYPVFIIFSAFLFSTHVALVSTILSIGSIYLVLVLDQQGRLNPPVFSAESQFINVSILLIAVGISIVVVTQNWRKVLVNLNQAYDSTLEGWAKALELRDKETEGHSKRVTNLALDVAQHLGFAWEDLIHFRRGALLHDIGKMAISDEILQKPGPLTPDERKLIEAHPEQAKTMLEGIPYLQRALEIPYCHHERLDGSGYPQGLAGEEIPFSARIFAVVDVWDALTSDRPYRKAWSEEEALSYIRDNSGILFDPLCVDAFLEVIA